MANETQNFQKQNRWEPSTEKQRNGMQHEDELDRMLDAALANYADTEPRAGLENRILANLTVERDRVPDRRWWRWGAIAALATLVIVVMTIAWRPGRPSHPIFAYRPPITTPNLERPRPMAASVAGPNDVHTQVRRPVTRRATHRVGREAVAAANPKLDQFPSRQHLSIQELALARYVSAFPQEATLIARAQQEYEEEIQQIMNDAHSKTEDYDSDQKER